MKKVTLYGAALTLCAALGLVSAAVGATNHYAAPRPQTHVVRVMHTVMPAAPRNAVQPLRRLARVAASQVFTDPTGDSGPGADIASTTVTVNGSMLSLAIQLSSLGAADTVLVVFDSDGNAATGADGIDYGIIVFGSDNGGLTGGVLKWNGNDLGPTPASLQGSFAAGTGLTLGLPLADLGMSPSTPSFNFGLGTIKN